MTYALYVLWGFIIGIISGCVGIGGGVVIVPSLVMLFGLDQLKAQGTSIALMIPPIGLLAAAKYWKSGNIVVPIAIFGALGVFIGGYFGASIAHHVGGPMMKKIFGVVLMAVGAKMFFS